MPVAEHVCAKKRFNYKRQYGLCITLSNLQCFFTLFVWRVMPLLRKIKIERRLFFYLLPATKHLGNIFATISARRSLSLLVKPNVAKFKVDSDDSCEFPRNCNKDRIQQQLSSKITPKKRNFPREWVPKAKSPELSAEKWFARKSVDLRIKIRSLSIFENPRETLLRHERSSCTQALSSAPNVARRRVREYRRDRQEWKRSDRKWQFCRWLIDDRR